MKAVEPDLTDRIADALPADIRADFYREMRHCRSLPDHDEMLRILRIMQFLTLLMEQVPARIGVERERLEPLLAMAAESLRSPSNQLKLTEMISTSDLQHCRTRSRKESVRKLSPGRLMRASGNSLSNPRFRRLPRHWRSSLQSCARARPNSVRRRLHSATPTEGRRMRRSRLSMRYGNRRTGRGRLQANF